MFPARTPGVALLILRLCIAGLAILSIATCGAELPILIRFACAALVLVLLCLGLFTPIACLVSLLLQAISLRVSDVSGLVEGSVHVAMTVALFLLGPGAYSIDAKRYGRRLIMPRGY